MKKVELFNDHFQNFKVYGIPHAQLIIADPPYNLGKNAYASNPAWYVDGDNKNGESKLANSEFFDTDKDFRPAEFMHFCSQMLVKEPKQGISENDADGSTPPQWRKLAAKSSQKHRVWFCFVHLSNCIITSNLVNVTDLSITYRLFSVRISRRKS